MSESGFGFVGVPVMPVFKGMSKEFAQRLEKPAKDSGKRAGKAITDELDAAVANLERQVKASEGKLAGFAKASEAATAKQQQKKQELKAVTLELQAAEEKYQKAVAAGNSGTAELAKVEKAKGRVLKVTNDVAIAEGDAKAAAKKYEDQQKDLADTSAKLVKAQDDAAKGVGRTSKALGDGDKRARSFKESILKIGVGVGAAIGAIGGLGKAAYDLGAKFDDAYDAIRVGTGASGEAFEGLQESLRNVAKNSVGVGGDIAEIGTTLADLNTRLGVTGEPLEKLTSQFQQLQGMGIDADINKVTGALQQFGIEGNAAPEAMDNLFRISQATGRSITEITDNLSKSGPALQEFGFGLEESAGLLGALDKAGLDSEKTLGSMTKALGVFAKEGKDPQEALQGTIREIDGLVKAGDNVKAIDVANKVFGAKGGAGFVAAVKSGKLQYEDFMNSIGASGDTIDGVANETADFAEQWDQFKLKAMLAIEPVAGVVFSAMVPALELGSKAIQGLASWLTDTLVPGFKAFGEWVQKNEAWLKPLAAVVGTVAGAFAALAIQAKIAAGAQAVMAAGGLLQWFKQLTVVTNLQTAAQAALNLVMNANPIFLIVTAIAAVVAGLAVFFTKTETGRQVWQTFMDALSGAWEWITTTFAPMFEWLGGVISDVWSGIKAGWDFLWQGIQTAWNSVLLPVFTAIFEVAKVTIGVIAVLILTPLLIAWNLLSAGIKLAWETVIKPVWDAMSIAAQWLWTNVLQPVFQWIGEKFSETGGILQTVWLSVIKPVWDALAAAAMWLWDTALRPVFQWIGDKFSHTGGRMKAVYDTLIRPMFDAFGKFVKWVWDTFISPAFQQMRVGLRVLGDVFVWAWNKVIKPTWDALGRGITWVVDNAVKPAFHGLQRALDVLKGWFKSTVDAIGKTWDTIKEKTREPIAFVVNTVYNRGIRKAWNAVGKLVSLPELPEHKFARGGILPGYTPGRDPYTFIEPHTGMTIGLSGGEAVLRPEATRELGPDWVDGVNAAARMGGAHGVRKFLGGFSQGGIIDSIVGIVNKKFPMMSITSTFRPGDPGHHGAGRAVDFSNGFDSTPEMRAAAGYFASNYGKELLELIHSPFNTNIKNGKSVGDGFGFYGAGTMNGHRNHVHVAAGAPLAGGGKGGLLGVFDGVVDWVGDKVKAAWDRVMKPIKDKLPSFPGIIGGLPKKGFEKFVNTAWDFVKSKIPFASDSSGAYHGKVGAGVEQWRGLVEKVLKSKGHSPELADTVLRRMNQESGGNARAINNWDSNAAAGTPSKGLMQVIDPTFQANKDPGYDDIWDPEANIRASMNYAMRQYGSLPAAYNRAGGYADGGIVDLLKHLPARLYDRGGWLNHGELAVNKSGKPEPVFTNAQWGVLSRGFVELGKLVPAIKGWATVQAKQVNAFEKWLGKTTDPHTEQGVAARSLFGQFGEIAGMLGGENIAKVADKLLSAEKGLLDAREAQASRLATIADKEKALAEARKALQDVKSDSGEAAKQAKELDKESKEKIKEAEEKLAEARKSGKADKIAKAEKDLGKVRKDTAKKSSEAEKKRAEEASKAADGVAQAEAELAKARLESVQALDMPIHDLIPSLDNAFRSASKLASKNGLGGVAHALAGVAALTGPQGVSVGFAIEVIKTGIDLVTFFVDLIKELIEKVHKVRVASRQAVAGAWEEIANYAKLTFDLQQNASKLQQELVRGVNEQRAAEFKLRVAQQDRLIAAAEGELAVAQARLALDEEIKKGAIAAQLKLMGLQEDWDTYMAFQALAGQGVLEKWSDAAISALFKYEAARAKALQGELQARVEQIQAEAALAEATRKNARNQQDLLVAQERLIRMSAKVAGVDLVEAQGGAQASKLLVELFEAQSALDKNVLGRWGYQMGAQGSFANEYRGQLAQQETLRKALDAVLAESGVSLGDVDMQRLFAQMGAVSWRGGDPMDVIRAQLPQLVEAEAALKINESLKPIYEAKDSIVDATRQVEDLKTEIDLHEKVTPLEETIKGLEYAVKELDHSADAFAQGNEKVRAEFLAAAKANAEAAGKFGVSWKLDEKYAAGSVREQIKAEYTIHLDGRAVYTADEVDELLKRVTQGSNVRATTVISSTDVAARRKERV